MSVAAFVVIPVLVALVAGAAGVWWGLRLRRGLMGDAGISDLSWQEGNRALKLARRGPVPQEPAERARLSATVAAQLGVRRRMMRWALPFFVALASLQAVVFAFGPTAWGALNVFWPLLLVLLQQLESRTLTRRLRALRPEGDTDEIHLH